MNGTTFYLVIKNLNCHKFLLLNMSHIRFSQILSSQHHKISLIMTFVICFPKVSSQSYCLQSLSYLLLLFPQTPSPLCRASSKFPLEWSSYILIHVASFHLVLSYLPFAYKVFKLLSILTWHLIIWPASAHLFSFLTLHPSCFLL